MAKPGRPRGYPKSGGRDFKPGAEWTGSPGGQTKEQHAQRRLVSEELARVFQRIVPDVALEVLAAKYPGLKKGATWNEAAVHAAAFESGLGNVSAHVHVTDRLEGKVKQQIDVRNVGAFDDDTLDNRIAELLRAAKSGEEKPN